MVKVQLDYLHRNGLTHQHRKIENTECYILGVEVKLGVHQRSEKGKD